MDSGNIYRPNFWNTCIYLFIMSVEYTLVRQYDFTKSLANLFLDKDVVHVVNLDIDLPV